jgi:uncharacterized damage-inducible protein DinB
MTKTTAGPALGEMFLAELEQELVKTRTVLERIPEDKLDWRPHRKSMSMGQLGYHIATVPGGFAQMLTVNELELPQLGNPQPANRQEILDALEQSAVRIREVLGEMSDTDMHSTWRVTKEGQEIMAVPKTAVARSFLLNHWYHHRGQLTVYLRLHDVPLPSVYGPTADENPFV